jgi:hypothetical protein
MADVAWPDKMITQAEAFAKASLWPLQVRDGCDENGNRIPGEIELACVTCGRSMGQLAHGYTIYNGSLDEMLSMVLRHMVMAHDEPLNTRGKAAPDDGT